MQPTCAAEGNQCELARIVATLDRDYAYGLLHRSVDDADNSGSELFRRQLRSVPPEPFYDQATRALKIESETSTQKELGQQSTEKQVGVRHRRLCTTTVANGARIGSGGFRPDPQGPSRVEPGDRTSPGTYGMNVQHGHADWQASNLGLTAGTNLTVHHRNVGGSSSHIEGDDSFEAAAPRQGSGANYAASRPGEDGAHRLASCKAEAGDAAAGLHDKDAGPGSWPTARAPAEGYGFSSFKRARSAFEILQISLHHRLQVSVHKYRASALVFAELGENQMGDRQRYAKLFEGGSNGIFRFRIRERKEQRNCNRLGTLLANFIGQGFQLISRGRLQCCAIAAGALLHTEAQRGRNQRLNTIEKEIVKLRPSLAADLNSIFETSGGDQCHLRALALQQGVGANGCAMEKNHRTAKSDLPKRFDNRLRRIIRGGEHFEHTNASTLHPDTVREGAAGVNGDVKRWISQTWWHGSRGQG